MPHLSIAPAYTKTPPIGNLKDYHAMTSPSSQIKPVSQSTVRRPSHLAKLALFVFSVVAATKAQAASIAAWDLTGSNTTATVTATASSFDPGLAGAPVLTRGSGAAASTGNNSFRTVGFKNDGISTANSDYFQTILSAAPGFTMFLSTIDARFNGTSTFF